MVNPGDDADAINAVINAASEGDTIIFKDGDYNLTDTIRVSKNGLTFSRRQGRGKVVL